MRKQIDNLNLSWRDKRYHRFYAVVDRLVDELQEHVWVKTGKPKRRLKGDGLEKLHYSVECLVRDCMAVVLQRKRKSEAAIRKGQYYYSSNRPDQMLTYSIHIERPFEGLIELGYLEVTKLGYFDRKGRKDGTPTSRLSHYIASDRLLGLFTLDETEAIPAIIPTYEDPDLIRERSLHRVFNDSDSHTRGHFYGGWWQNIPRGYRPYIVVNAKQMVELDYSNQHPSILYAQEGITRPDDCYSEAIKLKNSTTCGNS